MASWWAIPLGKGALLGRLQKKEPPAGLEIEEEGRGTPAGGSKTWSQTGLGIEGGGNGGNPAWATIAVAENLQPKESPSKVGIVEEEGRVEDLTRRQTKLSKEPGRTQFHLNSPVNTYYYIPILSYCKSFSQKNAIFSRFFWKTRQ